MTNDESSSRNFACLVNVDPMDRRDAKMSRQRSRYVARIESASGSDGKGGYPGNPGERVTAKSVTFLDIRDIGRGGCEGPKGGSARCRNEADSSL